MRRSSRRSDLILDQRCDSHGAFRCRGQRSPLTYYIEPLVPLVFHLPGIVHSLFTFGFSFTTPLRGLIARRSPRPPSAAALDHPVTLTGIAPCSECVGSGRGRDAGSGRGRGAGQLVAGSEVVRVRGARSSSPRGCLRSSPVRSARSSSPRGRHRSSPVRGARPSSLGVPCGTSRERALDARVTAAGALWHLAYARALRARPGAT